MTRRPAAAYVLALILTATAPAGARAEAGRTAASFLQRSLGARAAGMGGAYAAVRGDIDSIQYNPAGLGTLPGKTLTSSYLNGLGGTTHGLLAYAHPFPLGTVAVSARYFNAGKIDLNLSNGTSRTVSAEKNTAWTASYGVGLPLGLNIGASYRLMRLELAETASATTSQADLGFLLNLPWVLPGLSVAGAYQNLGPDIKFESAGDPPPKTLRYGLAFHFPEIDATKIDPSVDLEAFDMTIAVDQVHVLYQKASPRFGTELGLTPHYLNRIAIRFGWIVGRDAESLTFGIGLQHKRLSVDYGLGRAKDVGNLQQVTFTLHL